MRVITEDNGILYELKRSQQDDICSCSTCEYLGASKEYNSCVVVKFCHNAAETMWGFAYERAWRKVCPIEES